MTSRQLEILQHALGLDKYGHNSHPGYQCNHYCAGGDDVADCAELVAMGYTRPFRREWLPYFNCIVTEEGKAAVRRESPQPPKLTRSQQRYLRFLDADSGLPFGEWLMRYGGKVTQ